MTRPGIRELTASDIPSAGRLLAARHGAHRRAEPLLSATYEDPVSAATEVEALVADGATGAVAVEGGEVTGFLLGVSKPSPTWGDNIWVESAGQALTEAETVRDLYAAAATPGRQQVSTRTTCSCRPTTTPWSTRGSASASASSTCTRSATCPRRHLHHRPG